MARTAELILRLVDQVTAPARAINRALATVNTATAAVHTSARNMRRAATDMAGFSIPMLAIGSDAAQQVFEFEKVGNAIEAVTDMTTEQREQLEVLAQELNSEFPATNAEIMGAALELAKSGMMYEQIRGSLRNTLQLAQAGDFGIQDSSAILIATATAMRMAMDTELEAAESTAAVADTLAFAANRSLADIPDLGVTMRYVASAAAATGMELDELGAVTAVLANNGIMGSNAGTGLRYALLQLLNPSKAAANAFERLGINLGDYVTGAQKINATDVVGNLALDGIDIAGLGLEEQIQGILDDERISKSPAALGARITELINENIEGEGIIDSTVLAQSLNESLTLLGTQVDLRGLMAAFRENPDSEALFGAIFGKQHAVKMMALLAGDLEGMIADFEANAAGAAARMSEKRMQGIVGQWYEMTAAIENLYLRIADTGILLDAARAIDQLGTSLTYMSTLNPELLKMGTYGLLALASMAPLGWALSGMASSIAFIANPITLVAAALGYLAYLNWNGITYFFNAFTRFFQEGIDPAAVQPLLDLFEGLKQAASDLSLSMDFSDWGRSLGEGTANLVNQIPALLEFFKGLQKQVQPFIDMVVPMFTAASDAVGALVNMIGRLVGMSAEGAVSFFQSFMSSVDPNTIETLRGAASAVIKFSTGLWRLIEAIANWVGAPDQVAAFTAAMSLLGQGIALALDLAVGAVNGVVNGLKSIPDLITQMDTALSGVNLYQAGLNMMMTLADGIRASAGALMQAAMDAVAGIPAAVIGAVTGGAANGVTPAGPTGTPTYSGPTTSGYDNLPVPGYASGGSYNPGMILTGEKGPELQMASGRGQIFTAQETRDMLSGRAGGGGDTYHNWNITGSNADEIVAKITSILDSLMQRSRGLSMEDRLVTE